MSKSDRREFVFRMYPDERATLYALADARGIAASQLIKALIREELQRARLAAPPLTGSVRPSSETRAA